MGDECLDILTKSYSEYEYLERIELNLNRNDISPKALCEMIKKFDNLGMINHIYIQAKKNIKKIGEKDAVRDTLNKLLVKKKKIDL